MTGDDNGLFEYHVGIAIEELIEQGWSKEKVARFLREKAGELDPRTRTKTINPFTVTDEELSKLPEDIQKKVRAIREKFKGPKPKEVS
jgi:hypothetical protein